jgi:hypothetical protein
MKTYSNTIKVYTFEDGSAIPARSLNEARRKLGRDDLAAVRCTLNGIDQWPLGYRVGGVKVD